MIWSIWKVLRATGDLLPGLSSFVVNHFCYQTSKSLPSLSRPLLQCFNRQASKRYNLAKEKGCKRVAQRSRSSCNVHSVSAPGYYSYYYSYLFNFFFWRPKFFYGDHFTIEGRQKATFWKSELGALRGSPLVLRGGLWSTTKGGEWKWSQKGGQFFLYTQFQKLYSHLVVCSVQAVQ